MFHHHKWFYMRSCVSVLFLSVQSRFSTEAEMIELLTPGRPAARTLSCVLCQDEHDAVLKLWNPRFMVGVVPNNFLQMTIAAKEILEV